MFLFLVHDQSIPTFLIDSDILTLQSVECAFDSCFFVTDQPFIFSGKELVLSFCCFFKSQFCVCSFRKNYNTLETTFIYMTRCIMKCCCIYFNCCTCRNKKRLYFGCVICKIRFDILLCPQKQNDICNCDIPF